MRVCPKCFAQEAEDARFCGLCGTKLFEVQPGSSSLVGLVLEDKYIIQRRIAVGGMGEVYLAQHREIGQRVAVKILNRRFRGNETVIKRFFNEAKSYTRVTHPNAVKLYDFGQLEDGTLYIIMEFVAGETLTEHLAKHGPLPERRVLQIAMQLADVLLAAHAQSVVHRDLKPDNLMLQESSPGRYQLKVLDFGIAKLIDETSNQLTETGMVFGTPEFMSPEQAQGFDVDERTDIYAFGMLLYYMSAYRLPFDGKNKLAILNKQVHEAPPSPKALNPDSDLGPGLEAMIMTCVRKQRTERYRDFEEVLEDLERVAAGEPPENAVEFETEGDTTLPDYISIDDGLDDRVLITAEHEQTRPRAAAQSETVRVGVNHGAAHDPLQEMFDKAPGTDDEITIVASPQSDPELAAIHAEIVAEKDALDDAVTTVGPSDIHANEGFSFQGSDSDSFSLGDGLAINTDDDLPAGYQRRGGGGGLIGAIVIVVLVIGGVAIWFSNRGTTTESKPLAADETSPPQAMADVDESAPDAAAVAESEPDASPDAPPTIEPVEPSRAIDAKVRSNAVLRAALVQADEKLAKGELRDVSELLGKLRKAFPEQQGSQGKRIEELEGIVKHANDLLSEGKYLARKLRCSSVASKAIEMQEVSPGAVAELTRMVERCKRQLAAPPSTVD